MEFILFRRQLLKSVRIERAGAGKEISALFDYCLDGCNLQELYLMATYPPVCYSSTFTGAGDIFNVCTLYVPSGRKPIYRQAKGWGNFLRINEQ